RLSFASTGVCALPPPLPITPPFPGITVYAQKQNGHPPGTRMTTEQNTYNDLHSDNTILLL
ncbi:hypothetical protein OJO69_25660, partial [Escherichia coli]|nr:hypothetical protein [Escherichia coli]